MLGGGVSDVVGIDLDYGTSAQTVSSIFRAAPRCPSDVTHDASDVHLTCTNIKFGEFGEVRRSSSPNSNRSG